MQTFIIIIDIRYIQAASGSDIIYVQEKKGGYTQSGSLDHKLQYSNVQSMS